MVLIRRSLCGTCRPQALLRLTGRRQIHVHITSARHEARLSGRTWSSLHIKSPYSTASDPSQAQKEEEDDAEPIDISDFPSESANVKSTNSSGPSSSLANDLSSGPSSMASNEASKETMSATTPSTTDVTTAVRSRASKAEKSTPVAEDEPSLPEWKHYADRLDPTILDTMEHIFKYKHTTKVQQIILDSMPIQTDLLVRSKTGTGKTLAFLVPALQRSLDLHKRLALTGSQLKDFANANASTLIICPTRELAAQTASEFRKLVAYKYSNTKALCVIGGDSKRDQLKVMRRERNDFIVATPGRLLDMIQSDHEFASLLPNLQTLILDEADTLLEMGFRRQLEEILAFLPKQRQTYMFSATVSKDVRQIARSFLHKDHTFLNTVGKHDQDSHVTIKQEYIVRPAIEHMRTVLSLIISEQLKNDQCKIIIFFQTTRMTMLYATAFKILRRLYPCEAFQQFDIHAQRSQDSRAKVSKSFRLAGMGSLLFTTDVSARGVDYPDVSLVIQVGAPQTRDLYIHRSGRTGRAGKPGHNVLLLHEFERDWVKCLKDSPIVEKDFPDSEIALGPPQAKVFDLMRKTLPPAMLDDTYMATAGATLPRRHGLCTPDAIVGELTDWYREYAPDAEPPHVGVRVDSRSSGGIQETSDGARGSRDGPRPGRFSNVEERDVERNFHDHLPAGQTEWRPLRPSEYHRARRPQFNYNRVSPSRMGSGENDSFTLPQSDRFKSGYRPNREGKSFGGRGKTGGGGGGGKSFRGRAGGGGSYVGGHARKSRN